MSLLIAHWAKCSVTADWMDWVNPPRLLWLLKHLWCLKWRRNQGDIQAKAPSWRDTQEHHCLNTTPPKSSATTTSETTTTTTATSTSETTTTMNEITVTNSTTTRNYYFYHFYPMVLHHQPTCYKCSTVQEQLLEELVVESVVFGDSTTTTTTTTTTQTTSTDTKTKYRALITRNCSVIKAAIIYKYWNGYFVSSTNDEMSKKDNMNANSWETPLRCWGAHRDTLFGKCSNRFLRAHWQRQRHAIA